MSENEKTEDFLICEKCMKYSLQLNGQTNQPRMADILLGSVTIDALLPYVCDSWSTSKKLVNIAPFDFQTLPFNEFSLFEHILLYKFWYKILDQSLQRKLHEDLYKNILEKSQVHIVNCQNVENRVVKKVMERCHITDQVRHIKQEHFFFKEVFVGLQEQFLNEQNINFNKQEKAKLLTFMGNHLKTHKIITDDTVLYYNKFQEALSYERISEIYVKANVNASEVKTLLVQLRNSPSFEHSQSQSFRKLDFDYSQYNKWEQKTREMVQNSQPKISGAKVMQQLKDFKGRTRESEELSTLRYDFLKSLFTNKMSIEQARQLTVQGRTLFIQDYKAIQELETSILLAAKLSGEIKQAHRCSSGKPVKYLLEKIVEMSQYCVKPQDLSKVLKHWKSC